MPSVIQVNMTRGEITPLLHARIDLEHYRAGLAAMYNWVPLRFGGATRFPGSIYYGATKDPDRFARFIPFEFRRDQTYAIEAGHGYFRFWNVNGQVESSPGVPYEVSSPYDEADLPYIQYRQSGDVIYLACDGYAPRTLTRVSETNWALALYLPEDGPYLDTNATAITITPSGTSGSVTLTASNVSAINGGTGFASGDVNRPIRLKGDDGSWRWARITAITSTTVVTATLLGPTNLPNTNPITSWRLGAWSGYTGYPAAVGIFEDRLGWGGTVLEPLTAWYSVNADYDNFTVSDPQVDDDAITIRMTGGKLNGIQWLSDGRDIVIGTEGTLRAVGRNDFSGAFSATNARQRTESTVPTSYIPPLLIENMLIVLDIYRTRLLEAAYTQEADGYVARELSALNEHLLAQGIRDWAYQASPHKVIWMVTDQGTLLAGTYDRDQQVFGVSECDLGEGSYAEAVLSLPGTDKDGDQLWLIVRREVDGDVVRYVELLSAFFRDGYTEQDYPIYGHCAGVYFGTATNIVTGVDHLVGETIGVWSDGVDAGNVVVQSDGSFEFPEVLAGELIVFGLRYDSYLETLRLPYSNAGAVDGVGRRMTVSNMVLDVYQAYDLYAGAVAEPYRVRFDEEVEEDPYEAAVLRTGAGVLNGESRWSDSGVVAVLTNSMHPATLRAVTVDAEVED